MPVAAVFDCEIRLQRNLKVAATNTKQNFHTTLVRQRLINIKTKILILTENLSGKDI